MTNRITRTLVLAMLLAPAGAYAQGDAPVKNVAMDCPMMGQMTAMQKDMSGLMDDMDAMMKGTSDSGAKARMQAMRQHMTAMMKVMGGGMMGGAMPHQGSKETDRAPSAAPSAEVQDHDTHHPGK